MIASSNLLALFTALIAAPQDDYRLPPPEVAELVDAAPTPTIDVSPDARWILVVEHDTLPAIKDVARPWKPLGGMRIDTSANGELSNRFLEGSDRPRPHRRYGDPRSSG